MRLTFLLMTFILLNSCADEVVVKPGAELRLEYPEAVYDSVRLPCPFQFEKNTSAKIQLKGDCNVNLEYAKMKATVYITYQKVKDDNLKKLLSDAQKLTYDHTVKANEIFE